MSYTNQELRERIASEQLAALIISVAGEEGRDMGDQLVAVAIKLTDRLIAELNRTARPD